MQLISSVTACCLLAASLSPRATEPICDASTNRRDRRAAFWKDKSEIAVHASLPQPPPQLSNPLPQLLEAAEEALKRDGPTTTYDGDEVVTSSAMCREGERLMCQVTGASYLGLSVAVVPSGAAGLVYADEVHMPWPQPMTAFIYFIRLLCFFVSRRTITAYALLLVESLAGWLPSGGRQQRARIPRRRAPRFRRTTPRRREARRELASTRHAAQARGQR